MQYSWLVPKGLDGLPRRQTLRPVAKVPGRGHDLWTKNHAKRAMATAPTARKTQRRSSLRRAEIDRWLSGKMRASELHPASESALREWPIDRRVNKADVGDDDSTLLEPIESNLL